MHESEPKTGMSTGIKVLLWILGIGTVMVLLCCGGAVWWFRSNVHMTQNPQEIDNIAKSIADIDLPAEFQPMMGMDMKLVFSMKMAGYQRAQEDHLLLMEMVIPGQPKEQSEDAMKQGFQQQMQQQGQQQSINIKSRETKKFKIDGEEREFEFIEGVNSTTNKAVHQVVGMFSGRGGMAFLTLMIDDERWDEDEVTKLIESISTK